MARYTGALSFLLVLVLFCLVNIEARESKFFTKAVVIHANNTTKNVTHHVEPPSPSPSPLPSPSPASVEAEINGGYGLYGRDEIPNTSGFTSDSLTEEFNEKYGKDEFDNNELPNNYNEHSYVTVPQGDNKDKFVDKELSNNGLPSNYNERSYVTVPQGTNSYDTKFTTATNYDQNEFANNEEKLTPEEEKLFEENRNYNYENSYVNVNEPQKLSETPKFAEMDNTYKDDSYNVKEPQGMSDTRTLDNGKYHYALNSEGYYGNNGKPKSKYEFDTMEEFERQEGYSQEYVNP